MFMPKQGGAIRMSEMPLIFVDGCDAYSPAAPDTGAPGSSLPPPKEPKLPARLELVATGADDVRIFSLGLTPPRGTRATWTITLDAGTDGSVTILEMARTDSPAAISADE